MKRSGVCVFFFLLSLFAWAADKKEIPITDPLRPMTAPQAGLITLTSATLSYDNAGTLLQSIFPTLADKEYCVIHIVRWGAQNSIDKQNWYVFQNKVTQTGAAATTFSNRLSKSDFAGTRIYGVTKLAFVYVYLNTQNNPSNLAVSYKLEVDPKTPDNLQNLVALLKFVAAPAAPPPVDAYYATTELDVSYKTADLKFTAFVTPAPPAGAPATTTPTLLTSNTFDNEGRYFWDIGFSIPLKSYKDVQLNTTDDVVTPKSITRQNVFATFEVYPIPVDTKRPAKVFVPSLVAGIPISGKPLDRYIVALGLGTNFFRGFVGLGIDRRVATTQGTSTVPPPTDQWIRKLSFGITVPLRPVLASFKPATKGS